MGGRRERQKSQPEICREKTEQERKGRKEKYLEKNQDCLLGRSFDPGRTGQEVEIRPLLNLWAL